MPIHVDGASGGFLAPFVDPDLVWDFRLPRVKSINTSGHKFGLAPLGVGWVIWRDAGELPDDLIFRVNYLGGDMPTFALNFSRPGGQIVAQYYNFLRLGREGYRKVHEAGYRTAQYLADEIARMGPFAIIYDGRGGIPALAWKLREDVEHPFTLFDLADRLRVTGWQVPAYTLPANRQDLAVQRILVRHDFSRDMASPARGLPAGACAPRPAPALGAPGCIGGERLPPLSPDGPAWGLEDRSVSGHGPARSRSVFVPSPTSPGSCRPSTTRRRPSSGRRCGSGRR